MKTTLDLPGDLVHEIKQRAGGEGRDLQEVVVDLIRRGLGRDHAGAAVSPRKGYIDVPLFPTASDAPSSHMTIDEIIAVEQQSLFRDDLERLRQSV
jgi:hypothetical protein